MLVLLLAISGKFYVKSNNFEFFAYFVITRPNCALDRSAFLCLYVPGFQRQVFKHVKILSERSKESKEQKKNKGSVLVAESAYNAHYKILIKLAKKV